MGILPRVRELLVPEKGLRYVDRDGRELATMPADLFTGDGSPVTELEIMKGDLTVILHELIAGQTDIVYGDRISALDETPGGVEVTFRSGAVRTYDLVVGADGIYSGVRALAFGPESEFVTHLGLYLGYCTVPTPARSTTGSRCTTSPVACWGCAPSGAAPRRRCWRSPPTGSTSTGATCRARSVCSARSSRAWDGVRPSFSHESRARRRVRARGGTRP